MKFNLAIAGAVLPSVVLGFPQMMGGSKEDMIKMLEKRAAEEQLAKREPQLLTGVTSLLSTVLNDVKGLLGTCISSIIDDQC
jgi:hypothetical protein